MAPPVEANIFYIDDDLSSMDVGIKLLERKGGHHVVEKANTRAEVLEKIPSLMDKKVDIVVLDGNLTKGDESGRDGEFLAKVIKRSCPNIVVVGHALRQSIQNADINSTKKEGLDNLISIITNL